jgi:hypothetical protein
MSKSLPFIQANNRLDKHLFLAVLGAIIAASGVALGCALTLAAIDIYLAGHGRATLGRPWIDTSLVHMSRADTILVFVSLGSSLIVGLVIWRLLRKGRQSSVLDSKP